MFLNSLLNRTVTRWKNIYGNHANRTVQENQVGLKLKEAHQLLVYVDDANLLGHNIFSRYHNKRTLIDASKEVGLEVNTEEAKYDDVSSPEYKAKSIYKCS
jgi:hypothetical protein